MLLPKGGKLLLASFFSLHRGRENGQPGLIPCKKGNKNCSISLFGVESWGEICYNFIYLQR